MKERIKNVKSYEDFRKVFEIFKHYPFFEAWNEEEFLEEYKYLKSNGEIFGSYTNLGDIAGLITMIEGAKESHPVTFVNPDKVMYISDVAVLEPYRGNGYAKQLVNFAIEYTKLLNYYEEIYMRTNLENSMSEGIFVQNGFEVMKNNGIIITEDISFPRTLPDLPETDTRKFLSRKLVIK